ncbi:DciA family protein [Candidatus Kapabacteria bacterium]|nr:DciA family protein [Candidatus Kapabacteria bacterium]
MIGGSKDISEIVGKFILDNGLQDKFNLEKLKENVHKLFKYNSKDEIQFLDLCKGHLEIKSDSSAWREELKLRRNELIKKFNQILEKEIIKSIEVK